MYFKRHTHIFVPLFSVLIVLSQLSALDVIRAQEPNQALGGDSGDDSEQKETKAQSTDDPSINVRNQNARVLSGHRFITSELSVSPFLTTHFSTKTGVGFAELNIPLDEVGQPVSKNKRYNLGALSESFDAQVAINSWLALRGNFLGGVIAPANQSAALLFGAQVSYAYALGATLRLYANDSFQASVSMDYISSSSISFNILSAINNSIQSGSVDIDTILNQESNGSLNSGLHLAYGVTSWLGTFASLNYNNSTDDGETGLLFGASIDLKPISELTPIGFLLTYQTKMRDELSDNIYGVGFFYTGRDNLLLGIDLNHQDVPLNSEDINLKIYEGLLKMRYFW